MVLRATFFEAEKSEQGTGIQNRQWVLYISDGYWKLVDYKS